MKLIEQKHSNDCGIAALAMLYNTSYTLMRSYVLQSVTGRFEGTTIDNARYVADKLKRPIKLWLATDASRADLAAKLRGRKAIIIVPALDHAESGDYHAVYWSGSALYDPAPRAEYKVYGKRGIRAMKTFKECWVLDE